MAGCGLACKDYTQNGTANMDGFCGHIWSTNHGATYAPSYSTPQQQPQQQQLQQPQQQPTTVQGRQYQPYKGVNQPTFTPQYNKQTNCTSVVNGNVISTNCN